MVPFDEVEGAHKRSKSRRLVPAMITGLFLIGVVVYGLVRPAPERSAAPGRLLEFELPRLNGSGTVSHDDLLGRPVILNFWASWCIPCRREMPLFERMHQRFSDEVTIIGVDVKDAEINAKEFVDEYDITYEILRDPEAKLAGRLEVDPLPQTFFVDANGRLSGDPVLGEISEEELLARIEDLSGAGGSL
jgi:cytochrome c biogenesis protein CcmG, thiol:disulfide interchange protein DsbE